MSLKVTNNAASRLKTAITATSTSLTVETGEGSLFPSLSSGDYFYVTLVGDSVMEIVKVTSRNGDTFTITRAQDNTAAYPFEAGDVVELRINAACINDVSTAVDAVSNTVSANASTQAAKDAEQDAVIAGKLDKSGGTMTGSIRWSLGRLFSQNGEGDVYILGMDGKNDVAAGAGAYFFNGYDPNHPGAVQLATKWANGDYGPQLWLERNGNATWNNNPILTSAGGDITGILVLDGGLIRNKKNDDITTIQGGNSASTGGRLEVYGANRTVNGGSFVFTANDGTSTTQLLGKPNGTLTWNGNTILTSAGGTVNNLVLGKNLPEGGELSFEGPEGLPQRVIVDVLNGTNFRIFGVAKDGTVLTSHIIQFNPETGSFTKGGSPIITLVASWKDGNGNWYRKYSDGWIEQGGIITIASTHQLYAQSRAFHTPFASKIVYMGGGTIKSGNDRISNFGVYSTSLTAFNWSLAYNQANDSKTTGVCWYACGY